VHAVQTRKLQIASCSAQHRAAIDQRAQPVVVDVLQLLEVQDHFDPPSASQGEYGPAEERLGFAHEQPAPQVEDYQSIYFSLRNLKFHGFIPETAEQAAGLTRHTRWSRPLGRPA